MDDLDALTAAALDDPTARLILADYLEETGNVRHAALVRFVVEARWEEGYRRFDLTTRDGILARVAWWGNAGLWFWRIPASNKLKGTTVTATRARAEVMRRFLCHHWPASICLCSQFTRDMK